MSEAAAAAAAKVACPAIGPIFEGKNVNGFGFWNSGSKVTEIPVVAWSGDLASFTASDVLGQAGAVAGAGARI